MNTARSFQNILAIMREPNQAVLKIQTQCADIQRPAHHVRGCSQPKRLAHDVRPGSSGPQFRLRDRGLLVIARRPRRDFSIVSPAAPHGWSWSGLCGTTRCSAMDSLTIGHSHPNGTHRLSGHGLAVCTHPARSASPPPNHTRTPNQHTLPPPQTTRSCPHTWHTKKHWSTPSNAPHINNSWTPIQRAILISKQQINTGAHLQQPNSEAHRAHDRCFQVSLTRRLTLAHPGASHSTNNLSHVPTRQCSQTSFAPVPSMPISSTALFALSRHHVTPGTCSSPPHTRSSLAPTTHSCSLHALLPDSVPLPPWRTIASCRG